MIFHYLARGVILMNGKVLLAHQIGANNTFLPGGHIELGERAELALARELAEEIGKQAITKQFIGAVEWLWTDNNQTNHEINLIFEAVVPGLDSDEPPRSQESHLEFIWSKPAELRANNLKPDPLIECLTTWERGYRGYWGSFKDREKEGECKFGLNQIDCR
jgi:8-oxo-dGTP diphosphatase